MEFHLLEGDEIHNFVFCFSIWRLRFVLDIWRSIFLDEFFPNKFVIDKSSSSELGKNQPCHHSQFHLIPNWYPNQYICTQNYSISYTKHPNWNFQCSNILIMNVRRQPTTLIQASLHWLLHIKLIKINFLLF